MHLLMQLFCLQRQQCTSCSLVNEELHNAQQEIPASCMHGKQVAPQFSLLKSMLPCSTKVSAQYIMTKSGLNPTRMKDLLGDARRSAFPDEAESLRQDVCQLAVGRVEGAGRHEPASLVALLLHRPVSIHLAGLLVSGAGGQLQHHRGITA